MNLNDVALQIFRELGDTARHLRAEVSLASCGATMLDVGVHCKGGLEAGIQMARICLAGQASVSLVPGERRVWPGPWIQVRSDWPVEACMLGQYAGWPVKHEGFFAMGSGPMRIKRGREEVLEHLGASDSSQVAVGTLECDALPTDAVLRMMAEECGLQPSQLFVAIAPTSSLAGCVQVVARSVETSLHKLHDLGFDLRQVRSAWGVAPLPTVTPDFGAGIGRTNDAILYGGQVTLWVEAEDVVVQDIVRKVPSCASSDFGKPFAEIFKACGYDFYKVDPGLFSPAEVTIVNLATGNSWRGGEVRGDLVAKSFGTVAGGL